MIHTADPDNQLPRLKTQRFEKSFVPSAGWIYWLMSSLLALILIGYGTAGSLAEVLQLPSTQTSYPYRGLVLGLSAFALCFVAFGRFRLPIVVTIFLILYLFRLLWDYQFAAIPDSQDDLLFFVAVVLVPILATGIIQAYFDERRAAMAMGLLGIFACFLILYGIIVGNIQTGEIDTSKRASFESLNAITISYIGAYTAVCGYLVFRFYDWRIGSFLGLPMLIAGAVTLVVGGSRGPLVSLAMFLLLYAVSRRSGIWVFILAVGSVIVLYATDGADLAIFSRFTNLATDPSVLQRLYIQDLAIDSALNNPLFGEAYLELTTLTYPHNLLIESGMALGITGLTLMIIIQVRIILDSITLIRAGQTFLPFVAVFALTNAQLSGSLFGSVDIYLASVLTWLVAGRIRQSKREDMLSTTNHYSIQSSKIKPVVL